MRTFDIPTADGYKTVKANSKQEAISLVPNAKLTTPKIPTVLNSSNMNTSTTESKLPPQTALTSGAGLGGAITSSTNSYKSESEKAYAERLKKNETLGSDLRSTLNDIMDVQTEIGNVQNSVDRTEQEKTRKIYDDLTSQIEQEQASLAEKKKVLQQNSKGMSAGAVIDEIKRIEDESYARQANLSISQNIAGRNYDRAKDIADKLVEMKLEPLNVKLSNLKFFYEQNKSDFTTEDDRLYSEMIKKQETELKKKEEFETVLQGVKMEIMKQGGGVSMLSKLDSVQSLDELLKVPGVARFLSTEEEKLNLSKLRSDLGEGLPDKYANEFAATIDLVANMESSVYGKKTVATQLKNAIASKDYSSAYAQIANSVENGLVGEAKQRYTNAKTDYQVLTGLGNAIQEYSNAGGNMGLLKGTYEQIINRLGRVSDPKYKSLATQLVREFQTYRNTMTGAAFSPQESREYASVNPLGNKSLDFNLAVIDGALNQLQNRVEGTINARVPSAKYILEYATNPQLQGGAGTQEPQTNTNDPLGLFN